MHHMCGKWQEKPDLSSDEIQTRFHTFQKRNWFRRKTLSWLWLSEDISCFLSEISAELTRVPATKRPHLWCGAISPTYYHDVKWPSFLTWTNHSQPNVFKTWISKKQQQCKNCRTQQVTPWKHDLSWGLMSRSHWGAIKTIQQVSWSRYRFGY